MAKKKKIEYLSDEDYQALIDEVKRPKSDREKRFIKLGWDLIRAKFCYYVLDAPELQDFEYDNLERDYDELAKELSIPPTAADMVGFDNTRPSCNLAADKVQGRNIPLEKIPQS